MARRGDISSLTQSSVAIEDDQGRWFLINASPDLPAQIAAHPDLQPAKTSPRNTPIAGVLLTNADLDHTLGLLSLREGGKLNVYATRAVREAADVCPGVTAVMEAFGGITWHELPEKEFMPLRDAKGVESTIQFRAIGLPGKPPKFAKHVCPDGTHSIAYQFVDGRTGGKLLVAPDVAGLNDGLTAALKDADAVLFDGTFWSADELGRVKARAASAGEMGHVTMQGGSVDVLKGLPARRRIYIHINNTNPVLRPGSPERDAVESAGITVGFDGLEFEL
jgi:pyrroloquinoline quinone biosynthesis protein B